MKLAFKKWAENIQTKANNGTSMAHYTRKRRGGRGNKF